MRFVLGVRRISETDHCYEVSFCFLDKPQGDLFLGQAGRGPGSCCIAVDHTDEIGVFYPPSARNPREMWILLFYIWPSILCASPPLSALGSWLPSTLKRQFVWSYRLYYFHLWACVDFIWMKWVEEKLQTWKGPAVWPESWYLWVSCAQLGKTLLPTPKPSQTPKLNNISPGRKTHRTAILSGFLFCFLLSCQFSEVS